MERRLGRSAEVLLEHGADVKAPGHLTVAFLVHRGSDVNAALDVGQRSDFLTPIVASETSQNVCICCFSAAQIFNFGVTRVASHFHRATYGREDGIVILGARKSGPRGTRQAATWNSDVPRDSPCKIVQKNSTQECDNPKRYSQAARPTVVRLKLYDEGHYLSVYNLNSPTHLSR